MRTIADYRQLNDALFHAGLDSGSAFEWVDHPNGLHFYVIDLSTDEAGILSYTLGIRSLAGSGQHRRGASLAGPARQVMQGPNTPVELTLTNTGSASGEAGAWHPSEAGPHLDTDIFRYSVSVNGEGWTARILNALGAVPFGDSGPVTVYVTQEPGSVPSATLTVTATSESDPSVSASATVEVSR
jgi:hypothetical protein